MFGESERVDLLVRGGTVLTVDSQDQIIRGDIAIRDGLIVKIGTDLGVRASRVLDARGAAVIPGLVNSHMHETLDRSVGEDMAFIEWLEDYALPKDSALQPHHIRAAALLNQAEMIAGGTTTFIDIFRHPAEAAAVAEMSGLRAIFSPQVIDDPAGPGETLDQNIAFIEQWRNRVPDRIFTWFGPHSLYSVRPATFRKMRELANRYGVGIHTHLAESRAEAAMIAEQSKGLSPVRWLDELIGLGPDVVAAHCVEIDDSDMELLAARQVGIAHCPTSNAKLGNGRARVAELLAHGAVVGIGTDSNMTNNDLDMFEEMRLTALIQKQLTSDPTVLPARQVLRMATMGSAQVLGMSQSIGSVEVGKRADLAIIDLNGPHSRPLVHHGAGNITEQLVWSCSARDVRHTVVDGAVLMEDRRLTTLDVEMIVDLADRELLDLLRVAGVLEKRFGTDSPLR